MLMVPANLNMFLFWALPNFLVLCTACSSIFLPLLPHRALTLPASTPNIMGSATRMTALLTLLYRAPLQTRALLLTTPPLILSHDAPLLEVATMLAWRSTLISFLFCGNFNDVVSQMQLDNSALKQHGALFGVDCDPIRAAHAYQN